ncbi:hypothetical protein [Hyalangium gracile]|uniref:hypothetical protein n=1 Tax=Hyalangium gracile TaxID=394092 RepID=UPI001CCB4F36|nr:hypothetical protein [Hyalangium gracile]
MSPFPVRGISCLLLSASLTLVGCARSRPRPVVPPRAETAPAPAPSTPGTPAPAQPAATAQAPAPPEPKPAEPPAEELPPGVRFTPPGGMYSVEFPATPQCSQQRDQTVCSYTDAARGWTFSSRHWKDNVVLTDELEKNPSAHLQGRLNAIASNEGLEVLQNDAIVVDGFPAAEYRLSPRSDTSPPVHSAGQYINLGEKIVQVVHLHIEGKEAPPENVLQHFVKSFRTEGGGQGLAPLPPSSAALIQAPLLKPGVFQYRTVVQTAAWGKGADREPLSYALQTMRRSIQRKRDKKREAILVTDTGRTQDGKFDYRYWLDAKTLVPYKMVTTQTKLVGMTNKNETNTFRMENIDGVMKMELGGSFKGKLDHPVGNVPLFMPNASLELAVAALPLEEGFLGSLRVFELTGIFDKNFHSDWRVLVQHVTDLQSIGDLQAGKTGPIKVFKVELFEHKAKDPRKYTMWIENAPTRRILQVEAFSKPRTTTVQMIQTRR